ncbi:hypothetical protein [Streptosporangium sp. NPDC000396]|uniref:hypothetical protein n=1 Tax=Streptosporangium sp. NPDC000396 TaxID=3366185 RepID=UPI0036B01A01
MALVMRRGVFREEALRRYRAPSRRDRVPMMIRTGTLVGLWAVVVLLVAAAVVFAVLLRARIGGAA